MNFSIYSFLPLVIIILAAVYVFGRQKRKHRFEYSLFLTYEQLQQQTVIPKRDILDSLLFSFVGLSLLEFGIVGLWATYNIYMDLPTFRHDTRQIIEESLKHQMVFVPILLGGGFALMMLGIRSVVANVKYNRQKKSPIVSAE